MPATATAQNYSPAKAERLEARISGEQKQYFQYAANLLGRSLTDFVIQSLQEAANQVMQKYELIELTKADRELFVKNLLNPPAPNKKLKDALRRHKKEVANK